MHLSRCSRRGSFQTFVDILLFFRGVPSSCVNIISHKLSNKTTNENEAMKLYHSFVCLWHILQILIQCNAKQPSVAFVKRPQSVVLRLAADNTLFGEQAFQLTTAILTHFGRTKPLHFFLTFCFGNSCLLSRLALLLKCIQAVK